MANAIGAPKKLGEKFPVYGQATAPAGQTLTISEAPTVTIYDSTGAAVAGLIGLAVTGSDAGAQLAPRAWYDWDTLSPVVAAAGVYAVTFSIPALGSDGIARVFEPSVAVKLVAPGR